jgi:zinc/manganese transport system permease protein
VLTIVLAVIITWVSLAVAFSSVYPVGFYVSTFGFGLFVLATGARALATWMQSRSSGWHRLSAGTTAGA